LAEKVKIIHGDHIYSVAGVARVGIPPFLPADGPCAVRPELADNCTYLYEGKTNDIAIALPPLSAVAATWNPEMGLFFGETLGNELRARGKDMSLGPAINIMRTPLDGRTFEFMGEDPFLAGHMAAPVIRGIQSQDVAACVKHFVANNQELDRYDVNVTMDERTLREIYLPGFETAIKEGESWGIMGAYNKLRGQWCCENPYLLKSILRNEWGFKGVVVSDWGAVHDMKRAALAGCDLEMKIGSDYQFAKLEKAVENGELAKSVVDEKARRMLWLMAKIKKIGPDTASRIKGVLNTPAHRAVALSIAEEAIVLLKNENNILPLNPASLKTVLCIGRNANLKVCNGGGSGEGKPPYEITALDGLRRRLGDGVKIEYISMEPNASNPSDQIIANLAKTADAVLIFTGDSHAEESEGKDRTDIKLPKGQDEMVEKFVSINPCTVIINESGAPVAMPWVNKAKALIQFWFCGQEGGNALAAILFGDINPSGKLPCTFPKKLKDIAAHALGNYSAGQLNYAEGVLVGYRWFDAKKIVPLFPFGYGLSYTTFDIDKPKLSASVFKNGDTLAVDVKVTNTGKRAGAEVVQLYIAERKPSVIRPPKELKAFQKVFLQTGESKTIRMKLVARDFSFWDTKTNNWKVNAGAFDLLIGNSSRHILRKTTIHYKL
ncbi:glycoside hydrolase family 3 C-terminal domain-containing protein, partial [Arachidicoccus sp.]|uniref:glycoside hydrolase family 3 C-terminal domain-containing protein n=1 Tax=Arachidicoccus sp. TaxID=1872624 RepID=UPI003D1A06A9